MRKMEPALAITLGATLLIAGCGGTPVRPDDMSAEEHAREARTEGVVAEHHDAQYDPNALETRVRPSGIAAGNEGVGPMRTYNPTEIHHEEAAEHREHAAEHLAAAQALRGYEAADCRAFPPDARAACPLLSDVTAIEDVAGGVRIVFAPAVAVDTVIARMRCHFAYARTRAYEGMESCPLYVRGVDVRAGAGHSIELFGGDPAVVRAIREEARMTTTVTPL